MVELSDATGVLSGFRWRGTSVSYAFAESADDYPQTYSPRNETESFSALNAAFRDAARAAFDDLAALVDITFTETSATDADIVLGQSDEPFVAWAYGPESDAAVAGDVWFNPDYSSFDILRDQTQPYIGSYGWVTLLHEIGHALGLKHGHEAYNGVPPLSLGFDGLEYSIMTYRSYVGDATSGFYSVEEFGYPQSPQLLDIAALQATYGANYGTQAGDTVYSVDQATGALIIDGAAEEAPVENRVFRTLWDGGGRDRIDLSAYTTDLAIDLRPGEGIDLDRGGNAQRAKLGPNAYAPVHLNLALDIDAGGAALIEEARGGSGDDILTGNAADNLLMGGPGRDRLETGAGADVVMGTDAELAGDTYTDFSPLDRVVIEGGAAMPVRFDGAGLDLGRDETLALPDLPPFMALEVTTLDADLEIAWASTPVLVLGDGGERYVAAGSMPVTVKGGEGEDTLVGPAAGGALMGGGGSDQLIGFIGDDRLDGGAGSDELTGGGGRDIFTIRKAAQPLFEIDTITDFDPTDDTLHLPDHQSPDDLSIIEGQPGTILVQLSATHFVNVEGVSARDLLGALSFEETAPTSYLAAPKARSMTDASERLIAPKAEALDVRARGGDDFILGSGGDDRIHGGAQSDQLIGLAGSDTLAGGAGSDVLTGGAGADIFFFAATDDPGSFAVDTITDFDLTQDRLFLDGFDVNDMVARAFGGGSSLQLSASHYVLLDDIAPEDLPPLSDLIA